MLAEDLVAAPRGRRMCFSAVSDRWTPALPDELVDVLNAVDPDAVEALSDWSEAAMLVPFANSVDRAMYWQEPDDIDQALAAPEVRAALLPVARAVASAPSARWWSSPVDLGAQVAATTDPSGEVPEVRPAAEVLAEGRAETLDDEHRSRKRPADPNASFSGFWWSTPSRHLVNSTRARPVALGLCLEEDSFGPEWAWCRSVRPTGEPRVYEIAGPRDWCALAERYPMDVTLARKHDWYRVTGMTGRWVIPDWEAVAADHDAVHLTLTGYLTTAGRALPVGDARTVLAGWDPDQTFWFTDALDVGEPVLWRGEPDDLESWAPAAPGERPPESPAQPKRPRGWRLLLRALRTRPGSVVRWND
ncbi:hypothetical protein [Saccharopolyspora tripterygii]